MKNAGFYLFFILLMFSCKPGLKKEITENNNTIYSTLTWDVTKPPENLGLDPFYKKYVNVNGIHIISSRRVPDSAITQACNIIMYMTDALPSEIHNELTKRNTRVAVMARFEGTTNIPEHAYLKNDTAINWDVRARGLGGDVELPLTTCAEENLLCYQSDKYHAEDILIHEFAHVVHQVGILTINPQFNDVLQKALNAAIAQGKWLKTYASSDLYEYWAEGVQDWFNVNAESQKPDGVHNYVNTRKELKEYDPVLYDIISHYFSKVQQTVSCHAVSFD